MTQNGASTKSAPPSGTYRIVAEKNIAGEYCLELEKAILASIEGATKAIIFDLSKISRIDSGGLGLCIGLMKECQRRNLQLTLEVNPEIRKFFSLMKFDKLFTLVDGNRA